MDAIRLDEHICCFCPFHSWGHAVQQLYKWVVAITLGHWVPKPSAPGQSGGRGCPHTPPAGRWRAGSICLTRGATDTKQTCLLTSAARWVFVSHVLCCSRGDFQLCFPRIRISGFPKTFQRSKLSCHSTHHLLVVSLWIGAALLLFLLPLIKNDVFRGD